MSDDRSPDITTPPAPPAPPVPLALPAPPVPPPARKPRLKRLRFLAILVAVLLLGSVSFVFGIFISITAGLPSLERFATLKDAQSSVLLDDLGKPIGVLSQQNRVIVKPNRIPHVVKEAVISIEDKRFYTNSGIDIRGIGRAFVQDVLHKGNVQGASTIEQQFIKNALQAQSHRTILEKLREAALAYKLSHKWSKDKILTAYLNTIYFGSGAYGIEAAAETYFGRDVNHVGCGPPPSHQLCVEQLAPWEAALLAGIIQSPTAYNPAAHPVAARRRRDLVLAQMLEQGYIDHAVYEQSIQQALPSPSSVQAPHLQTIEGVEAGYFTSWVQQQVIERYGPERAFAGGLRVKTTLDLELQQAAEQAVNAYLPNPGGPSSALVVIENSTGEVRAMVGGRNYNQSAFNLATQGERQPGSSFKAFDLAAALQDGISPGSVWTSKQKTFYVPSPHGVERFVVHNDEGAYSGSNTLSGATAASDNSIYAEVGLKVGTHRIARVAQAMGITTPLSVNPAMTIGGLTVGVTPLDMAHAYETIAHGGRRVSGSLSQPGEPVGIQEVEAGGRIVDRNHVEARRVLPPWIAATETSMLEGVVQYGTGRAAAIGQFAAGKTGTTTNYGDAWFVGWDSKYTVAVWVGYPDKLVPMTTDFNGQPVLGGTFPALIWHQFIVSALQIDKARSEHTTAGASGASGVPAGTGTGTNEAAPAGGAGTGTSPQPTTAAPATPAGGANQPNGGGNATPETAAPTPRSAPAPAPSTPPPTATGPAPSATPPASGGSPTGGVGPAG
jgi:penicillin-binding protein 1A